MSLEQENKLGSVWHEIRTWPTQARLELALRILHSLEQEQACRSQQSPANLIGVWKTDRTLSDTEIEQLLAEERMKKYG